MKKKKQWIFIILVFSGVSMYGQSNLDTLTGSVSYKTSQSIYVKFKSTKGIEVGDTLFMLIESRLEPALLIKYTSSTSCVGTPLTVQTFETGMKIIARIKDVPKPEAPKAEIQQNPADYGIVTQPEEETTPRYEEKKKPVKETEDLKGRLTAASYINFSDHPESDKQRMRYTFSLNARNINQTGLSIETYMSFKHTLNEWQVVQDHFKKAFKVYALALEYDLKDGTRFWLGRKINFNISNIGAIDGIQAEKKWNKTLAGVFAGSRPDLSDYGFNSELLQFGAYVGNIVTGKNGTIQNTLAIAEQRNQNMTDRRFAYFQHLNSMIRRVNMFTSFEFDLYKIENNQPKSVFDITSIYASIRYKVSDRLSIFGSYDARNNIIYYETYKNFIDQLLEDETRQGLRFSFTYHPLKKITIGSSGGYRFQKNNPSPSKNLYSYLTVSRIPGLQISATVSVVLIESAYMRGNIYGIRASRDLIKGKLFGEMEYRIVEYRYNNVEFPLNQSIIGTNLSWRFTRNLSFGLNYEGEIQNQTVFSRFYTNLIQRF